ncbi:TPA: hypothetical protein ACIYQJ_001955, partial [Escherichia coli]
LTFSRFIAGEICAASTVTLKQQHLNNVYKLYSNFRNIIISLINYRVIRNEGIFSILTRRQQSARSAS